MANYHIRIRGRVDIISTVKKAHDPVTNLFQKAHDPVNRKSHDPVANYP